MESKARTWRKVRVRLEVEYTYTPGTTDRKAAEAEATEHARGLARAVADDPATSLDIRAWALPSPSQVKAAERLGLCYGSPALMFGDMMACETWHAIMPDRPDLHCGHHHGSKRAALNCREQMRIGWASVKPRPTSRATGERVVL